jgi:hypothetical protein
MTISIEDFYKYNVVDNNFKEQEYQLLHPETKTFYQPYCQQNNFTDKQRLYYHYKIYNNNYAQPNVHNKFLLIKPLGNISEQIKTINSFHSFAKQIGAKLKVYLGEDYNFLDLFQHNSDIDFVKKTDFIFYRKKLQIELNNLFTVSYYLNKENINFFSEKDYVLKLIARKGFYYEGKYCISDMFDSISDLNIFYKTLAPKKDIEYKNYHNRVSEYIGVRLFRPHQYSLKHQSQYRYDLKYIKDTVKLLIKNNPKSSVLLITDCEETKNIFLKQFKTNIVLYQNLIEYKNNDINNIYSEIDQLFVLSKSKKILASKTDALAYVASRINGIDLLCHNTYLQQDDNEIYQQESEEIIKNVAFLHKPQSKINHNTKDKIILYTQMFNTSTEVLTYNMYCLYKNLSNQYIDQIVLLTEKNCRFSNVFSDKLILHTIDDRLTYSQWLDLSNNLHHNEIKVLANSDIYFDDTIKNLHNITNWDSHILYVCSRKDETKNGEIIPSRLYHNDHCSVIDIKRSQDVWIYKNKIKDFESNYYLGVMNCDSKLSESIRENQMQMINLYFYINCIHVDWRQSKTRETYQINKS